MTQIIIIEPVFNKLTQLIKSGSRNALQHCLSFFGDEEDLSALKGQIWKAYEEHSKSLIIIDFTPMSDIGRTSKLHILEELHLKIPYIICVNKGIALEQISTLKNLSVIVCGETGNIDGIILGEAWKKYFTTKLTNINVGSSFAKIREHWVDSVIMDAINKCIRMPPVDSRQTSKIQLPDGAWANKWIDVKNILTDTDKAFYIAYQMAYKLTNGFNNEIIENGFIASNNTAYVIGSYLSLIFEKHELVVIDRIGPHPNLNKVKLLSLKCQLEGKRFCMIEDVISTGREIDLTQLLTMMHDSEITRVISLFNLEIAAPRLVNSNNILSLCNPSGRIDYKRAPLFSKK